MKKIVYTLCVISLSVSIGSLHGMRTKPAYPKEINPAQSLLIADYNTVEQYYNLDASKDSEWTLLHTAALRGFTNVVDLLLKQGIDSNVQNKDGETALQLAQNRGHTEIVKLLQPQPEQNHNADISTKSRSKKNNV